jgi:hypothetical protein
MPSFRPSAHGWPFADDYDCPAALIGLGRPVDPDFGFAGGMCWAALDRYVAGRRVPRTLRAPGPEDSLYAEFVLRLSNALAKDVIARAWEAQRLPDAGRGRTLARLSRSEWATARREMDAGRPVLLLLIKETGAFVDPTRNRFVLATRYDADPDRAMVWTYDPRRPGDDAATLMLDPGKGGAAFVGRMGREEIVRGLLAVPYDRSVPPSIEASVSPRDERERVGLEEDMAPIDLGARTLGLLARDTEAHLVAVWHDADGWHRERPADLGDVGADFRFEGAPVPAGVAAGRPSAIVRGVNGHLLHLRKTARGWSAEDLTDQPNTGLRFRIAGAPLVLRDGRRPVVIAVNADGRLLHYSWSAVRGWSADNLSKESGADAGARFEGGISGVLDGAGRGHIVGRNADGELVHFREEPDERWRGSRPGAARTEIRQLLLEGQPVADLAEDGAVEVYARGVGGHLLRFRLAEGGRWTGQDLTEFAAGGAPALTLASDPCVAGYAAGLRHILGRNADGDVVHFAGDREGGWTAANLTADRITVGPTFRVEGQPAAAAGGRTVLLAARRGTELVLYRWHGGGDWVAENLTVERGARDDGPRIASDPLIARAADAAHVVALSAGGTLVHYQVMAAMHAAARAGAPGLLGSVSAFAPALADFLSALVERFRKSEKAVGLRASPVRRDAADAGRLEPGRAEPADRIAGGEAEMATAATERSGAPAGALDRPSVDSSAEDGEDAASAASRRQDWGHPTSAPAPWHDEGDEGAEDARERPAAERSANARPPGSSGPGPDSAERDLLRQGSEWSGPRLVPDPGPGPVDDWDLALKEVSTAHERSLVGDHADEVVDEEDHASARIFLSRGDAEATAGGAEAPAEAEEPAAAAPGDADGAAPARAATPRESSTETVPGRPLVDLSFLSDIVQPGAEGAPVESGARADSADRHAHPDDPGAKEAPPTAAARAAPAFAEAPGPSAPPREPAQPARPPAEPVSTNGGETSPARPERAASPGAGSATAAKPALASAGRTSAGNPSRAPAGVAPGAAADPVVDLDFLATAGEYLGGGGPSAEDLNGFLEFLEQG